MAGRLVARQDHVEDGDLGWIASAGLREAFVSKRRHYDLACDALPSAPAWALFDRPPSFAHRPPAIREYWRIQQATYGRERLYPAWFRRAHPQMCV